MSSEIVQRPTRAVNPITMEVLELPASPTDYIAERYREMSNFISNGARAYQRALADELLARMDHERVYTVRAGVWEVTGDSPARTEVDDPEALYEALKALADAGEVSHEAVEGAFRLERKASKSGLNALSRVPGPVADVVAAHLVPVSRPRQVRVSEKGR